MSIVVTGFEPFGPEPINPSQEIVKTLIEQDTALLCEVLSTEYDYAEKRICQLMDEHNPALVLMLGLAESAPKIRMERIALNIDDASIPDNGGDLRRGLPIIKGAPLALQTGLDLTATQAKLNAIGHDVAISNHAGAYICNHIFYTALSHAAKKGLKTQCLFVHVPTFRPEIEGQRIEDMAAAIKGMIKVLSAD